MKKDKKDSKPVKQEKESLNLNDLEKVNGAADPFATIPRVQNNNYTDNIKKKI